MREPPRATFGPKPDGPRQTGNLRSPIPSTVTEAYRAVVLILLYVEVAMIAWTGAWLIISAVHADRSHFRRPSIADEVEVWLKQQGNGRSWGQPAGRE